MAKMVEEKIELPNKVEGKVTLFLESWQKRMLNDFLKGNPPVRGFNKIEIDFDKPYHLNTYRLPFTNPREGFEFYFTDVQKARLEELTGLKVVDSIRIDQEMVEKGTLVIR